MEGKKRSWPAYTQGLDSRAKSLVSCRGYYREHVEDTFKFDARTLASIAIWVVAVPTLIYTTTIKEYNKADDQAGRCRSFTRLVSRNLPWFPEHAAEEG